MRAEQWLYATAVYSSKSRLIYCSDSIDKSAEFDWTFRSLFPLTANYPRKLYSKYITTGHQFFMPSREEACALDWFPGPLWSHLHTCSSWEQITFVRSCWQCLPPAYSKENTFPGPFIRFYQMRTGGCSAHAAPLFAWRSTIKPSGALLQLPAGMIIWWTLRRGGDDGANHLAGGVVNSPGGILYIHITHLLTSQRAHIWHWSVQKR